MKLSHKDLMAALEAGDDDASEKIGAMQLMHTDILLAAAKGQIDLNDIARHLVASRGIGTSGEWVGFPEAERQMDALRSKARKTKRAA